MVISTTCGDGQAMLRSARSTPPKGSRSTRWHCSNTNRCSTPGTSAKDPSASRAFLKPAKLFHPSNPNAKSMSVVARATRMPCANDSNTSRAIAPTSKGSASGQARRIVATGLANTASPGCSRKSSGDPCMHFPCDFHTARIADRQQVRVHQQVRHHAGGLALEIPKASQHFHVAVAIRLQTLIGQQIRFDLVAVEGGCAGPQVLRQPRRCRLTAQKQAVARCVDGLDPVEL